jgi:hypothetical protein
VSHRTLTYYCLYIYYIYIFIYLYIVIYYKTIYNILIIVRSLLKEMSDLEVGLLISGSSSIVTNIGLGQSDQTPGLDSKCTLSNLNVLL